MNLILSTILKTLNGVFIFKLFSGTSVNNPFEVIIIIFSIFISLSLLSSSFVHNSDGFLSLKNKVTTSEPSTDLKNKTFLFYLNENVRNFSL
jgi:hypothetical protein